MTLENVKTRNVHDLHLTPGNVSANRSGCPRVDRQLRFASSDQKKCKGVIE